MRKLQHGSSGLLRHMQLQNEGILQRGQMLVEIEFLTKYVCPKTCVLISSSGKDRVHMLQKLFTSCTFFLISNKKEEYDPHNPALDYSYSVDITPQFVGMCRQRFQRVLVICEGETLARQVDLHFLVAPYRALLQLNLPYPTCLGLRGDLILPLFCSSCFSGLVYLDCTAGYTYYDGSLLEQELSAFQFLTRGFLNQDYDQRVERDILKMYYTRFSENHLGFLERWVAALDA